MPKINKRKTGECSFAFEFRAVQDNGSDGYYDKKTIQNWFGTGLKVVPMRMMQEPLLETELLPETETLPDADILPETGILPDAETLPETDILPDTENLPVENVLEEEKSELSAEENIETPEIMETVETPETVEDPKTEETTVTLEVVEEVTSGEPEVVVEETGSGN